MKIDSSDPLPLDKLASNALLANRMVQDTLRWLERAVIGLNL